MTAQSKDLTSILPFLSMSFLCIHYTVNLPRLPKSHSLTVPDMKQEDDLK